MKEIDACEIEPANSAVFAHFFGCLVVCFLDRTVTTYHGSLSKNEVPSK